MNWKQKIWLGVAALFILNIAFFIEDFYPNFKYWDLAYILIILVLLVTLVKGGFRWNLRDKKNKEVKAESFKRNFMMMNKKQLICSVCAVGVITIVTLARLWLTKGNTHPARDPFIIAVIIIIGPAYIAFLRLFREKVSKPQKDDQKQ